MDMNVKLPENISEEQVKKLKAAKSKEEMLELMQEMGIELTDDQLEGLAGGRYEGFDLNDCPYMSKKREHYE